MSFPKTGQSNIGVGVYKATPPVLTDGEREEAQIDPSGNLRSTLATLGAGEDLPNDRLIVEQRFTNTRITADTLVKSGVGLLSKIIVSQPAVTTPVAGVVTVYDNTVESGTVIFQHYFAAAALTVPITIEINCSFTVGCYVGFDATLAGLAFNTEHR